MKHHTVWTHLLLAGLSLALAGHALAQSPAFAVPTTPRVTVQRGSGPILLADINHDGHLDLITKHMTNRTVSVLLGDGRGGFTFSPECSLKLDFEPGWIAVADVNHGSNSVLAVCNVEHSNEVVRIFRADPGGHFKPKPGSQFSVPASTNGFKLSLRFVDLNEDGNVDLISANGRRGAMEIYLGDGRGAFSLASTVQLEPGNRIRSFGVGDLDGDGHLDLATTVSSSPPDGKPALLKIHRGDGKGHFAEPAGPAVTVPPDPAIAAVVDLNGDGKADILLNHGRSNIVTILLNDGKGGFSPRPPVSLETGASSYAVAASDINNDNHVDLMIVTVNDRAPFDSKIVVLAGDGRGAFNPAPGSPLPAAPGAYTLATGDINGDGKLDLVASSFESDTVTVLLGQ